MEVVVTTGAIGCAKLPSNHHHQQTYTQVILQAGCPSCRPTNSVKALKGETDMAASYYISSTSLFFFQSKVTPRGSSSHGLVVAIYQTWPGMCSLIPADTWRSRIQIAQFAITINSNVCPHIRVPNTLMRESYA